MMLRKSVPRAVAIFCASIVVHFHLVSLTAQAAAKKEDVQVLRFYGIRPSDPNGRDGLANPDRGFRLEIVVGETQRGSKYYPLNKILELPAAVEDNLRGDEPNDELWALTFKHYRKQGLTLALAYIYLGDYYNKDLPPEKIAAITTSYSYARSNGIKIIPLFLYESTHPPKFGATEEIIMRHLDQLRPFFQENADVMPWVRAGFIGAYGEWHNSFHGLLEDHRVPARIVAKELEVVPVDKMVLLRVPKYKRWVLGEESLDEYRFLSAAEAYSGTPKARLGHANDGFMAGNNDGYTWNEAPLFSSPGNPEFDMATVESAFTATEGEMFVRDFSGRVDGFQAILRLRLHHYCALSFFHGNNELERYGEKNPPEYGINIWMKTPVTIAQLKAEHLPISDGYFCNERGELVERTQFEYIRDHMGYRIELQEARLPGAVTAGAGFELGLKIINRGFATLHNPRTVYLALIDESGLVVALPMSNVNPQLWQPTVPGDAFYRTLTHQVKTKLTVPRDSKPGIYQVGLWLPDRYESIRLNPAYAVRFANRDTPWWVSSVNQYGVNIIGKIQVIK